jgi:hypothetical protein
LRDSITTWGGGELLLEAAILGAEAIDEAPAAAEPLGGIGVVALDPEALATGALAACVPGTAEAGGADATCGGDASLVPSCFDNAAISDLSRFQSVPLKTAGFEAIAESTAARSEARVEKAPAVAARLPEAIELLSACASPAKIATAP